MASDESIRGDFRRIAQNWRNLAGSYQFAESLERFTLNAERAKKSPPEERELSNQAAGARIDETRADRKVATL